MTMLPLLTLGNNNINAGNFIIMNLTKQKFLHTYKYYLSTYRYYLKSNKYEPTKYFPSHTF